MQQRTDAAGFVPVETLVDAGDVKDAHRSRGTDADAESADTISVPTGKCEELRIEVARGSYTACNGVPGHYPDGGGPDGCPPTGAEEYGASCCNSLVLSCGIQTADAGCVSSLHRPGQSAGAPPACEADAGLPGQLLEAVSIYDVTLSDDALFVRYGTSASARSQIVSIDKQSCAQEPVPITGEPEQMAVTARAIYLVRGEELFELAHGSSVETEIELPAQTHIESIVALGPTLYLSAFEYGSDRAAPNISKVYELTCCSSAPRLRLSTTMQVTTKGLLAIPSMNPASAERVVGWDVVGFLDSSVKDASLTLFDLERGESDYLLYEQNVDIRYVAARDGSLLLAMRDGILALNVDDCAVRPLRVHAGAAVEAIATHGRDLFWLETSPHVDTARLLTSRDDGAPVQLLETSSSEVSHLRADESHVYWVEHKALPVSVALMRAALPTPR